MITSSPARAAQEFELNDSRETAHGPLAGGTSYTAGIETLNDTDWFVFYVKTYSQVEISASAGTKSTASSLFYLYDRDGEPVGVCCGNFNFSVYNPNIVERYSRTMTPGRYYLRVEGNQGARYKFTINPAASLTTSRECGEAIVAKDLVGPLLIEVNEDLAKIAGALAVKAAAVRAAKGDLRQAVGKVQRLRKKVSRVRRETRRLRGSPRPRRKLRRTTAKLRVARSEVRSASEQLDAAKEARQPIWQEKLNLDALASQHQLTIANADAQIAAFC